MRRRKPEPQTRDNYRWFDLARYNAEVARGVVHSEAWDAKMAEDQFAFNVVTRRKQTQTSYHSTRFPAVNIPHRTV